MPPPLIRTVLAAIVGPPRPYAVRRACRTAYIALVRTGSASRISQIGPSVLVRWRTPRTPAPGVLVRRSAMPDVPPYRRIADVLRARIGAGELLPGEPIPSARRVARDPRVGAAGAA